MTQPTTHTHTTTDEPADTRTDADDAPHERLPVIDTGNHLAPEVMRAVDGHDRTLSARHVLRHTSLRPTTVAEIFTSRRLPRREVVDNRLPTRMDGHFKSPDADRRVSHRRGFSQKPPGVADARRGGSHYASNVTMQATCTEAAPPHRTDGRDVSESDNSDARDGGETT